MWVGVIVDTEKKEKVQGELRKEDTKIMNPVY